MTTEREALPPFPSQIEALLGVYWQAGYDEGTGHDPEVDPNETLSRIREEVRNYARAALAAQAQGYDLQDLLEARAMLSEIGLICREQERFTGSYAEIVKQAFDALAAQVVQHDKQMRAAQTVIEGLERRALRDSDAIKELERKALDVGGEREANAILTAEVERLAAQVAQAEPMEMALCEATSVVLREGQLYRFRRVGDCERCAEMSKASFDAYGEPPKEQSHD